MARIEHILTTRTASLSSLLTESLGLHIEQTENLLWLGAIYCNKERLKCPQTQQIPEGSYLRVHTKPKRYPMNLDTLREAIIADTENYLVLNKPVGLPVHPTLDNQQENVVSGLQKVLNRPVYVTHRLDVGTSGLLLLAKNQEEQTRLNGLFQTSQVKKFYRATVHGVDLPLGEITHSMKPSDRAPRQVQTAQATGLIPGWLLCKLRILDQEECFPHHSSVFIELLTGRTHQIRAQLSDLGFPIVGDQMYGSPVPLGSGNEWALTCTGLHFLDKNGEPASYSLPEHLCKNVKVP